MKTILITGATGAVGGQAEREGMGVIHRERTQISQRKRGWGKARRTYANGWTETILNGRSDIG